MSRRQQAYVRRRSKLRLSLRPKMCFTSILLDTIQVLARHKCTYAIQVIVVHYDVRCGLLGGDQLEAIAALRRIVEDLEVVCIEDVYKILTESKVQGELVAEQNKKRKYESDAELRAEGRALLTTIEDEDELATNEHKFFEQEQQSQFEPSSPAFSPSEPVYSERVCWGYSEPACWADDL